ncbi:hypothetical protein QC758_11015 [Halomonas campisalis]|nr:hypothetical protein [Halomonas campisalis]
MLLGHKSVETTQIYTHVLGRLCRCTQPAGLAKNLTPGHATAPTRHSAMASCHLPAVVRFPGLFGSWSAPCQRPSSAALTNQPM